LATAPLWFILGMHGIAASLYIASLPAIGQSMAARQIGPSGISSGEKEPKTTSRRQSAAVAVGMYRPPLGPLPA
jgi:hypothetical protein